MRYLGVDIVTKAEGQISKMHIGLGGTMSALFLRQLAQKTLRGLEGRVKQDKSTGGMSHGYALDRQPRPDGPFTTSERVVDEAEAAVVRRIFTEYDKGKSARAIAIGVNRDGIAPLGRQGVRHMVLLDHLGELEARDRDPEQRTLLRAPCLEPSALCEEPDTGKRQARPNPPEECVIKEVPDLRTVDEAPRQRVKRRQGAIREDILHARVETLAAPPSERSHRPIAARPWVLTSRETRSARAPVALLSVR